MPHVLLIRKMRGELTLDVLALGLIIGLSVGGIAHALFLLFWLRSYLKRSFQETSKSFETSSELRLSESVQKTILDLVERVGRSNSETREALAQGLSQQFLNTQERLDRALAQNRQEQQSGLLKTTQALELKFQSLEQQVGMRLETIGQNVESKLNDNLKEGFKHFEKVQSHLQAAELKLASLNTVGQSISDLNSLLKLPHLRGGFGEATLERILADFLPASSFEIQFAIAPHSTERVDAVVKLAQHLLPIDSKFPRESILPLFESNDPTALEGARKTLADIVKTQAKSIATKYIRPEHGTTDMALLFLPSETLYFEVIRNGELFEALAKLKVFPVSPNTLSISLRSVSIAQEYYEMARGVEQTIEDVKKAKRHFEHFEKRFDDVGKGLKKAQDAFETANTHLNRYGSSIVRLTRESSLTGDSLEPTEAPSLPVQ